MDTISGPRSLRHSLRQALVLVAQPAARIGIAVKRHFLPGSGVVREIIVTALHHDMICRQDMLRKP
jgi:hypothetical protein